jgi:Smg protein
MKENVFDVLMYLFENYYMDEDSPVRPDRAVVQQELSQAGFPMREIDRAFTWMDGLTNEQQRPSLQAKHSIRHFSAAELDRLDTECRGFLLFLEQMGVLNPETRELAIDRAMALETEDFDMDQLKWVILMVLFNQPGAQEAYAWVEDLLFDSSSRSLH